MREKTIQLSKRSKERGQQLHKSWDGSMPKCSGTSWEAGVAVVKWVRAENTSDKIKEAAGN